MTSPRSLHVLLPALVLCAGALSSAHSGEILATRLDGQPNRAAWMARGTHGVMVHYLIAPKGNTPEEKTADLNRVVDHFDVEHFLKQIDETKADWLILTLGQTTGYFCAPNAYLDAKAPGHTPRRDLVGEIAQGLRKQNKRLFLYLASGSSGDPVYRDVLAWGTEGGYDRYLEFVRSYAQRYGDLVAGWWFDGCGPQSDADWQKWMAATRSGNADAVAAFSGAEFCCGGPVNPLCGLEDYHAGEIHLLEDGKIRRDFLPPGGDIVVENGKLRKRGQEARYYMPDAQFIDNVQWHCLLPIDLTFNPAVPNQFCHYRDRELFRFVEDVKRVGGAITINVPLDTQNGHIFEDTHAQLVRLGQWLADKSTHPQPEDLKTCWGTPE
ncbi:MAG: hypothetical protein NTW96_03840 [Planctomycetia bacterium]|nr:hypothetical protein [Planctomycetia bacterium]